MTVKPLPLDENTAVTAVGHIDAHDSLAHYVNAISNSFDGTLKLGDASSVRSGVLLGRTTDVRNCTSTGFTPVAGTVYLSRVETPRPITVRNLAIPVLVAGTGATALANCYLGLYDSAGARLGVTAEQHAAWATVGVKTAALAVAAPIDLPFVYIALLVGTQSTTPVQFVQSNGLSNAAILNWEYSPTFLGAKADTGASALPTTSATIVANGTLVLAGLS